MAQDIEQATRFDRYHDTFEGNPAINHENPVLLRTPPKGFHSGMLRRCVPFVTMLLLRRVQLAFMPPQRHRFFHQFSHPGDSPL
jgi:hypothetical protein